MVMVVGLGFVGLTTALGLAELGNKIYGYDIDTNKMDALKKGNMYFQEPELKDILCKHINKNFIIGTNSEDVMRDVSMVFFCVGTPCDQDGAVDLSILKDAVRDVLTHMPQDEKHRILIIKSTVPPGTASECIEPMVREMGIGEERISVVSNPEFLREGLCWYDFMHPGRIIIGSKDDSGQVLLDLFRPLQAPMYIVSTKSAEYSKYLSNVMLATLISFSNEMAHAAQIFGDIDVKRAFEILHNDERLKDSPIASYIYPGCGYGGYCLPKDIKAFVAALSELGYNSQFLNSVIDINNDVISRFCDKICCQVKTSQKIGLLGLAFKTNTDDVRESSAYKVYQELMKRGYTNIWAYDPIAMKKFEESYDTNIIFCNSSKEVINEVDAVVITTAWDEFIYLDYQGKTVFDGRYFLDLSNQ